MHDLGDKPRTSVLLLLWCLREPQFYLTGPTERDLPLDILGSGSFEKFSLQEIKR